MINIDVMTLWSRHQKIDLVKIGKTYNKVGGDLI